MLQLRPYQIEAVEAAERKNRLIADECGLGKTLQAIELAKRLRSQLRAPVLIVVTKSIKAQWAKALEGQGVDRAQIFLLDSKHTHSSIVEAVEVNNVPFNNEPTVIVAHYEAVVKHAATLQKFYFALIVADEAHKIRNRKAQRTQALKSLQAFRKVAMTGTPWDRNPADVWSILNFLDPRFYSSYWKFYEGHINYARRMIWGREIKEIHKTEPLVNPEGFARVLRPVMIRRYKKDVRPDLPERIDQIVPLAMEADQARAYKKLFEAEDILTDLGEGVEVATPIVLTHILRLIQLTTDPALLGLSASSAKLEWLKEWLEENREQSFIVFSRFRDTAEKVHKLLTELEIPAKLIVGGSKRPEVTSADRAIVGTIAAMGEGLDLPHIDYAIFLDVEWSSILMQQAIDRIHRINIENVKHCLYLQCENTVDSLVYQAVVNKWGTQELAHAYIEGRNNHG